MQVVHPYIEGLLVLTPRKFEDERGYFTESFNQRVFNELVGADIRFVQDNESVSSRHVLRGLHFQKPPHAQGKLVRVSSGSVLDIAVDLRKDSPTFGKWHGEILSAANGKLFWIPEGFAHGFIALEDHTKFLYKCTDYYAPDSEGTLRWNDPTLNIDWGNNHPIVSEKDKKGRIFEELNSPF
ncbi:dTDP-4-dehydrorhamnose 3,5-epimerase [Crocinitomicaceae bacterium CZZ-1]|uniref:dTDP-4-dehydrorhamnose 3,5-epimerase n=1 Tax=Taishania pollutisoli TaxID=2766479 RepID=A0A8J6TYZ4_9FLAO|nr:dTDP-4-dehydrorhamnose 3,5-epimerase [Taishania pollutisoli]MBC9811468.1 dTDP-4-dehydrorhamnose 3,5-epimerase [Taishania pollutisoli]